MKRKREREEHLEQLWYMKESGKSSLTDLKDAMMDCFNNEIINELENQDMVKIDPATHKITLTASGDEYARKIIRSHRLAERLICDVLGEEFETGAGEFEHMINPELVDSICTLLGHPRQCPHGKAIPQGECCMALTKTATATVVPVTELLVGESASVAYVQCSSDQQLHRIEGLQIRPGAVITLHQKYPTFVIECEGAHIALEKSVALNIKVWTKEVHCSKMKREEDAEEKKRGFWGGFRRRNGRRMRKGAF